MSSSKPHEFSHEEKIDFLKRLPPLELSYEPKLHKKVYADLFWIIPKGPKALIWYTFWNDQNVCLLITLNERGNYNDVKLFPSVFSSSLSLSTIIYGTFFYYNNLPHFTAEKLYYYKGIALHNKPVHYKINLLYELFLRDDIVQHSYSSRFLVVGLPAMTASYDEAMQLLDSLPYRTYGIGSIKYNNNNNNNLIEPPQLLNKTSSLLSTPTRLTSLNTNKTQVFKVKATIVADIYNLYDKQDEFVSIAAIPTYKTSVMMNALFRNIKENTNLDLLEESDDEEEFENNDIDKFVDLEKTLLMECVYLKRFQKWQPIKVYNKIGN